MKDPFENPILCNDCNVKIEKTLAIKSGFKLRAFECRNCGKVWYHPLDMQNYKNFVSLRKRNFQVKLRYVGNSFCVSIPREIIEFEAIEREIDKKIGKMISMMLEEPGKLSLFFSDEMNMFMGERFKRRNKINVGKEDEK